MLREWPSSRGRAAYSCWRSCSHGARALRVILATRMQPRARPCTQAKRAPPTGRPPAATGARARPRRRRARAPAGNGIVECVPPAPRRWTSVRFVATTKCAPVRPSRSNETGRRPKPRGSALALGAAAADGCARASRRSCAAETAGWTPRVNDRPRASGRDSAAPRSPPENREPFGRGGDTYSIGGDGLGWSRFRPLALARTP